MSQFVQKKHLSQYTHYDQALSSTAVSWQQGADLNVLAIQLLASLHLSLQGGRTECIEWSDEHTLETAATTKAAMKIIEMQMWHISNRLLVTVQKSLRFIP